MDRTDFRNKDNRDEFIGQIIDIFEDNLTDRDVSDKDEEVRDAVITLDYTDSSTGVFYGGRDYDAVAGKLLDLLINWKLA